MIRGTLTEICSAVVDCKNRTAPEDPNGSHFAVGTPAMRGNIINLSEARRINDETYAEWTARITPEPGDLLFAREAPVGPVVEIPEGVSIAPGQRTMLLRADPSKANGRFLRYYLISPSTQARIQSLAHGSTVPHLRLPVVRNFEVELPELEEQHAIAKVLGALDDKIAANTKLVETLVATFTAHWRAFSSFLTAETVTVGSLLGDMIGGDWGTAEATEASPNEVHCIRGADIADLQKSGLGKMPRRFLKTASLKRRKLEDGDLVVEMSGGSPTQSTGRSVLITASLLARLDVPLTSSNFCRIIRPTDPANAFYLYGLLQDSWQRGEFFSFENGSTGIKNLAFADYSSTKIVSLPAAEKLKSFNELARSLFDAMQSLGTESSRLAATRDALLPQLMSGKLRVKDAENVVEDVL